MHSAGIDEVGHLAAGISHLELGQFDLYRVNPPLVRTVAALPPVLCGVRGDWKRYNAAPDARSEFDVGAALFNVPAISLFYLPLARLSVVSFAILGGWVCFLWARQLAGTSAALVAVSLWSFSPNILAHGAMITPDCGAAAFGVAAGYAYCQWLKEPTWGRTFGSAALLGFAELTKFTWIVLFGLWFVLWIMWQWPFRSARKRGNELAKLATMLLLAAYAIHVGYGFEGSFQRLGEFGFVSETLGGPAPRLPHEQNGPRNRFRETVLKDVRVPVPKNYLQGIDVQKRDFEQGIRSYLHGEWKHGGWWYYYLYAVLIKEPLGYWLLGLLALWLAVFRRKASDNWHDEFVLLSPAVCVMALVSSQTGFNHHLRYVLPALPFIYIWIGTKVSRLIIWPRWLAGTGMAGTPSAVAHESAVAARPVLKTLALNGLVLGSLAWGIGSSLWYWPHSLSYFNELVGGPLYGHAHLVDSNIDWGQDLLLLKRWLEQHPEARPLGLAYFGGFNPRAVGIEHHIPPRSPLGAGHPGNERGPAPKPSDEEIGPRPGWYAISVNFLRGLHFGLRDGAGGRTFVSGPWYTYFLEHYQPVARAGYSIYIYHLTLDDANRVRRAWGLEELTESAEGGRGKDE
jgi:hypothetical protein